MDGDLDPCVFKVLASWVRNPADVVDGLLCAAGLGLVMLILSAAAA